MSAIAKRPKTMNLIPKLAMGKRELKYWQNELKVAWERAKAADTLGRYQEAVWWEDRAAAIAEEIQQMKGDANDQG